MSNPPANITCCSKLRHSFQICFKHRVMTYIENVIVLANTYALFWYGMVDDKPDDNIDQRQNLDIVCFCFLLFWCIHATLYGVSFGFSRLWKNPTDIFQQMSDRMTLVVGFSGLSLFVLSITIMRLSAQPNYFNINSELKDYKFNAIGRFWFLIPTIRLFTLTPKIARLLFGLLVILPLFWDVYVMFIVLLYMF